MKLPAALLVVMLSSSWLRAVSVASYGAIPNDNIDDTVAVQAALDAETDIFFPRGTYLVGNLLVKFDDALIHGEGFGSILLFKPSATGALLDCQDHPVGIEKLAFYGGDTSDKQSVETSPANRSAIAVHTQAAGWINTILVKGFGKYGIYSNDLWRDTGSHLTITESTFIYNWTAIQAGPNNAEYIRLSGLDIRNSWIAIYLGSGNITVSNSKLTTNGYGVFVDGTGIVNNGHGNVSGSLINHNVYPIYARDIKIGFNFTGNCVFGGTIKLDRCAGINITNGSYDVSEIISTCGGKNVIRGNFCYNMSTNIATHELDNTTIDDYGAAGP